MSEIYRGDQREYRTERHTSSEILSPLEIEEHLDEIERLLGILVEKGADLDPSVIVVLRQQLLVHLLALGVSSVTDPKLLDLRKLLSDREIHPPIPADYPTFEVFSLRQNQILTAERDPMTGKRRVSTTLFDAIAHAYTRWNKVHARGNGTIQEYTYKLGVVLCDEYAYKKQFRDDDIQIEKDGGIQNGRHRLLTLKTLGIEYVVKHGLVKWINVEEAT